MPEQNILLLQNWLKTVVTSPGHLPQKIARAQHHFHFNEHDIVAAGGAATVHERLNVYSTGYILRLLDCMAADYPVLQKFLGETLFDNFVKAYLIYHPSTSFTLYDLGKAFPEFLARTKPAEVAGDADAGNFLDLPVALARLERARQEVARAQGTETDDNSYTDLGIEDMMFQDVTISVPPCFRLLELGFAMKDFFEAVYRDEPYQLPAPEKTFMAISRKNYHVSMHEVTWWQYVFLTECAQPVNLYAAINNTAAICNIPSASLLADVYLWLPFLQANGFVGLQTN